VRTDAEQAAWLADKIVALGDYAKEAAEMLRRWPGATCHHEPWQGRCIHCDAPFKDGYAYKPKEKQSASQPSDDELDSLAKKHTTVLHQTTHGWGTVTVAKLDHLAYARAVLASRGNGRPAGVTRLDGSRPTDADLRDVWQSVADALPAAPNEEQLIAFARAVLSMKVVVL
jgi:hypothetical protein